MTDPPADLQRLVELHQRKRQLEAELKEVNNDIAILDEQLRQNLFEPNGYSSLRLNGATISIRTDTYVGTSDGVDREEAARRLARSKHFGYLVKPNYNANSLSAAVRERIADYAASQGDRLLMLDAEERREKLLRAALGPSLAPYFKLTEKQRLVVTKR